MQETGSNPIPSYLLWINEQKLSTFFVSNLYHKPLAPLIIWVQIIQMRNNYRNNLCFRYWLLLLNFENIRGDN